MTILYFFLIFFFYFSYSTNIRPKHKNPSNPLCPNFLVPQFKVHFQPLEHVRLWESYAIKSFSHRNGVLKIFSIAKAVNENTEAGRFQESSEKRLQIHLVQTLGQNCSKKKTLGQKSSQQQSGSFSLLVVAQDNWTTQNKKMQGNNIYATQRVRRRVDEGALQLTITNFLFNSH